MYNFCTEHLSEKIKYFFASSKYISDVELSLERRFSRASTIAGTLKVHKIIPENTEQIKVFNLSRDNVGEIKSVSGSQSPPKSAESFKVNDFVIAYYAHDQLDYLGRIISYNEEFDDFEIDFLRPPGTDSVYSYYFPNPRQVCNVSRENMRKKLSNPKLKTGYKSARLRYEFSSEELKFKVKFYFV